MSADRQGPAAGNVRVRGTGIVLADQDGTSIVPLEECWFAMVSFGPPVRRGERPCAVCEEGKFMRPAKGCWVEVGKTYDCLCFETERAIICVPIGCRTRPDQARTPKEPRRRDDRRDGRSDSRPAASSKPRLPAPDRGESGAQSETAPAKAAPTADAPRPKLPVPDRSASGDVDGQAKPVKRPPAEPVSAIERYKARYGDRSPTAAATPATKKSGDDSPKKPVAPPKTFAEALAEASRPAPSK